ncbi:MAG: LuxR C-terminal-related transcriptional regulator, partial [Anaerolineae bacterium]
PVLSTGYAFVSMSCGEVWSIEPRLRDAERWLETTDDKHEQPEFPVVGMVVVDQEAFRRMPGMIALIRGARALARGDMLETVKNARRVLDVAPIDDILALGGAASSLGLAAWASGDLDTACRMTTDGAANVRLAGYISAAIGGAIVLADIQIAQGCLREAMATYERGLQWEAESREPVLPGTADMYVGMSTLCREYNDLNTARQHLLTSQALGALAGLQQNPYRWCAAMARIREAEGDLDGAIDLLDQAECLYDANFSPNVRPIATRKVRVWLAQGQLGIALDWAQEKGLSADDELVYLREYDHITLARMLLACYQGDGAEGSIAGALGLLARLLKAAEEGGRTGSVIEILVLQALAHHARGNFPAALVPLQRALALAELEGYVRIFLDEGLSMLQLLHEASARKISPGYTTRLLAAFHAVEKPAPAEPQASALKMEDKSPAQSLIEPLSQRELEVLRFIAQGLSNRQIGERLFLALDTVKGHNRRIFGKLQVTSRTEAIARARELGLL